MRMEAEHSVRDIVLNRNRSKDDAQKSIIEIICSLLYDAVIDIEEQEDDNEFKIMCEERPWIDLRYYRIYLKVMRNPMEVLLMIVCISASIRTRNLLDSGQKLDCLSHPTLTK